ncbi:MAG: hypothetical protein HS113_29440 [Verrucomicrobiales bacterium]|nr:hypothetical protein [Verrucomicrobiales bacterium]
MPKLRRRAFPEPLLRHLVRRVRERGVDEDQLVELREWVKTEPVVPEGPWFKEFDGFVVCGAGELVKTFLVPGQVPVGTRI